MIQFQVRAIAIYRLFGDTFDTETCVGQLYTAGPPH
jgi:hypothetical protein